MTPSMKCLNEMRAQGNFVSRFTTQTKQKIKETFKRKNSTKKKKKLIGNEKTNREILRMRQSAKNLIDKSNDD